MRASDLETHKAERMRECAWCGEEVSKGESYMRERVWDGENAKTVKMHRECYAAMQRNVIMDGDALWTFGAFERGKRTHRVNGKAEQEGGQRA